MQILCLDSILANDVDLVSSTSTMVVEEYEYDYEDKVQILDLTNTLQIYFTFRKYTILVQVLQLLYQELQFQHFLYLQQLCQLLSQLSVCFSQELRESFMACRIRIFQDGRRAFLQVQVFCLSFAVSFVVFAYPVVEVFLLTLVLGINLLIIGIQSVAYAVSGRQRRTYSAATATSTLEHGKQKCQRSKHHFLQLIPYHLMKQTSFC